MTGISNREGRTYDFHIKANTEFVPLAGYGLRAFCNITDAI